MYFKCISHLIISVSSSLCFLHQMIKLQCVFFHRWPSILSFETGLTIASTRLIMVMIIWWWLWICWSWRLKWSWQWWETQVEMTVLIIKIHYVVLASDDQYRLSQDPALRLPILRPVSPLLDQVKNDDYERMVSVLCICVWECVFVFSIPNSCLTLRQCKLSHVTR